MNRTIARCLYGVLFAGGLTLLGATAAQAADTSGDSGVLSGTLVDTAVSIPVSVGGNTVSVLGDSHSDSAAVTSAPASRPDGSSTSGNNGIAGGSQIAGAVSVPVTIGGNAVAVVGDATSTDASTPVAPLAPAGSKATTSGNDSVGGGTQVAPVVSIPVTIGGNSVAVVGDATSADAATPASGSTPAETSATTSGNDSVAGGSQVVPVVTVPVSVGGNAVSVVGDSATSGSPAASATDGASPDGSSATTSGNDSVLGGTQIAPVVTAPVGVDGNAVSVVGDSATGSTTGSSAGAASPVGSLSAVTSGDESVLGGTQVAPVVTAPFGVDGNAVSGVGNSGTAGSSDDGLVAPARPSLPVAPVNEDVFGGAGFTAEIALPIDLGAIAVSVIGDSEASPGVDPALPTTPSTPANPSVPTVPAEPATPTVPTSPASPVTSSTPTAPAGQADPTTSVTAGVIAAVDASGRSAGTTLASDVTRVAASAGPNLAETGSNAAGLMLGFATLMLLAGAAIALRRRNPVTQLD
ncbi:MAG: chaplin family protein [Mycetocola sp.]